MVNAVIAPSGAGSTAREIDELEAERQITAAWRHVPVNTEWVEFRGAAIPVASMLGERNFDNTFTPYATSDRLPIWFKAAGSMKVYNRAPGPEHCGE